MVGGTDLFRYLLTRVILFWLRLKAVCDRSFSGRYGRFNSAGTWLTYTDDGAGQAIILVHGIIGDASSWNATVKRLKARFRLVAIDYRGQGGSAIPDNPADYGMQMVDDIAALQRHLGIQRACIIGASAGAEMALRLAVSNPDNVRALILIGSGWSGEKEAENYRAAARALNKHGSLRPWIKETGGEGYFQTDPYSLAIADLLLKGKNLKALVATFQGMPNIINLSEEEIRSIKVPILGICGEHDVERPCLEKMINVAQDFSYKMLNNRGHMDTDDDPEQTEVINEFLRNHLG